MDEFCKYAHWLRATYSRDRFLFRMCVELVLLIFFFHHLDRIFIRKTNKTDVGATIFNNVRIFALLLLRFNHTIPNIYIYIATFCTRVNYNFVYIFFIYIYFIYVSFSYLLWVVVDGSAAVVAAVAVATFRSCNASTSLIHSEKNVNTQRERCANK